MIFFCLNYEKEKPKNINLPKFQLMNIFTTKKKKYMILCIIFYFIVIKQDFWKNNI